MSVEVSGTRGLPRLELGYAMSEFALENDEFIGMQAFVPCPVERDSALYAKIVRESLLEVVDVKRGEDGTYNRSGYKTKDGTYACLQYGQEHRLDDKTRSKFQFDFDAEDWAARIASRRVLQAQEIRVKNKLFNTGTFTGADLFTQVGTDWTNAAAHIQTDVITAREQVRQLTGMVPNTLIMGRNVLAKCIYGNTEIKDAIKFNQLLTAAAIRNALAAYLDIPKILIGGGVYNQANEGQAFDGTDVWGSDYVMVACTADNSGAPEIEPCIGRTFCWTENFTPEDMMKRIIEIFVYREEQTESDIIRAKQCVDENLIDPFYAHLLKITV